MTPTDPLAALQAENAQLKAEVQRLTDALLAARDVLTKLQGELAALGYDES